jgi:hypothetical protein
MEENVMVLIRAIWHRVIVNMVFAFGCGEFIDRLTDH